jgi:hypothetical protein
VSGDRATKLTATFAYGSTDPDVSLTLATGKDYREVVYHTTYVTCDAGTADAAPTDARATDAAPADAGAAKGDASPASDEPQPQHSSGGCSFGTSADSLLPTLLVGLLLALRMRRR